MWRRLDLRTCKPDVDQLVNLRLERKDDGNVCYEVGRFEHRPGTRKLYFVHSGNVTDPTRWTKNYHIWWVPVEPFKAYK